MPKIKPMSSSDSILIFHDPAEDLICVVEAEAVFTPTKIKRR